MNKLKQRIPFEEKYERAKRRIVRLCKLDLTAPNEHVKQLALETLKLLKENSILPSLINSTGDESLLFEFFIGEHSFSVDFYNDGEIIYLRRIQGHTPYVAKISIESEIKGNLLKTTIRNQLSVLFKVCHKPDSNYKLELERKLEILPDLKELRQCC